LTYKHLCGIMYGIFTQLPCVLLFHIPILRIILLTFLLLVFLSAVMRGTTCILELLLIFTVLIVVCFIHNDYPPKRKKKKPHFHMFDFHIKDYAGGSDREKKN